MSKRKQWEIKHLFEQWFEHSGYIHLVKTVTVKVSEITLPSDFSDDDDPWRDAFVVELVIGDWTGMAASHQQMLKDVFEFALQFFFHRKTLVLIRWRK